MELVRAEKLLDQSDPVSPWQPGVACQDAQATPQRGGPVEAGVL